jgi:hypothetical protein
VIVGRDTERARLNALVEGLQEGRSFTLVVHGDAGVGKTTLLREAIERAADRGVRAVRHRGSEGATDLPWAGVAGIAAPLLARAEGLPEVQTAALRAALGLDAAGGAAPDHFTVPVGLLGLLGAAAEDRPLLVVADDLQWYDRGSRDALLFVARAWATKGSACCSPRATARAGIPRPRAWRRCGSRTSTRTSRGRCWAATSPPRSPTPCTRPWAATRWPSASWPARSSRPARRPRAAAATAAGGRPPGRAARAADRRPARRRTPGGVGRRADGGEPTRPAHRSARPARRGGRRVFAAERAGVLVLDGGAVAFAHPLPARRRRCRHGRGGAP